MCPLPWAPTSLVDSITNDAFTNTATRAMSSLADMGSRLMQPVQQQVQEVVQQALPAPMPRPAPQPEAPRVPRFSLGRLEDWISPAGPAQPAPQLPDTRIPGQVPAPAPA